MITPLYIALLGLFFVVLSTYVMRGRWRSRVAMGDADNLEMRRRIRVQGNFAEYTPLFLIMLGCAEYGGLPAYCVHLFGILFIVGRLTHAYSVLKHEQYQDGKLLNMPFWRMCGMTCTLVSIILLAFILLVQFFTHSV